MNLGQFTVDNGLVSLVPSRLSTANTSPMSVPVDYPESVRSELYSAFSSDYHLHDRLLKADGLDSKSAFLVYYMRPAIFERQPSFNSSFSHFNAENAKAYDEAERRLLDLKETVDEDGDPVVEEGAIDSAIQVLGHLYARDVSPPALTWHGGDAVVMLWALGSTTWAMTITDGEAGYVVRKNQRTARLAHSLPLDSFRLEDLR